MAGQPKAIIDWKKVDDLLVAGCSGREIAAQLGIYHGTLYDRCLTDNEIPFAEYSQQKYAKGDAYIRAAQFAKALGRNKDADNTMLIWLGKQRLGQTEKQEGQVNVAEELRKCISEIFGSKGVSEPECDRPPEQSILHQRPDGQENQIPNELGTT